MSKPLRLTVYVSEDEEQRLRLYAAAKNMSRSDVISECLRKLPDVQFTMDGKRVQPSSSSASKQAKTKSSAPPPRA